MAWETRGNRTYYYYKQRAGERVVSTYAGAGSDAALIARLEEGRRERDQVAQAQAHAERAALATAERPVLALTTLTGVVTRLVLQTNGYHQHKRQWRRRRMPRTKQLQPSTALAEADAIDTGREQPLSLP